MKLSRMIELFLKFLPFFYGIVFGVLLLFLIFVYWQTWGAYIRSRLQDWDTFTADVINSKGTNIEIAFNKNGVVKQETVNIPKTLLGYDKKEQIQVALNPQTNHLVFIGNRPSDRGAIIFGSILCATAFFWALMLSLFYLATRAYASTILKWIEKFNY